MSRPEGGSEAIEAVVTLIQERRCSALGQASVRGTEEDCMTS